MKSPTNNADFHKVESKRLGILDESGLENARRYIADQRNHLLTCRSQFVSCHDYKERAKKTMLDTERRIEEDRKTLIAKKQAIENDSRVFQERFNSTRKEARQSNQSDDISGQKLIR